MASGAPEDLDCRITKRRPKAASIHVLVYCSAETRRVLRRVKRHEGSAAHTACEEMHLHVPAASAARGRWAVAQTDVLMRLFIELPQSGRTPAL